MIVVQQAESNTGARPGDVVTITIVATNRGKGGARNATITVPFDPALLRLLDARLSRTDAWVSKLWPDSLIIQTGGLSADGDAVIATVRFRVQPQVKDGTPLAARLTYTWRDDHQIGVGRSNLLSLVAAAEPIQQLQYPLLFSTIDLPGDHAPALSVFSSPIFAPFEPVTFWYTTPDGRTIAVGTVLADANGQVTLQFNPIGLTPGAYTMVAHGNWTDFIATAPFQAP